MYHGDFSKFSVSLVACGQDQARLTQCTLDDNDKKWKDEKDDYVS
jgi:hypothetical protein